MKSRLSSPDTFRDLRSSKSNDRRNSQIEAPFQYRKASVRQQGTNLATKLKAVFRRDEGRKKMREFLRNVFMQMSEDRFLAGVAEMSLKDDHDDRHVYSILSQKASEARGSPLKHLPAALRGVRRLQKDLASQIETLLGRDRVVQGYLEIGYPGRMVRPIGGKMQLKAPIIVANDEEKMSDLMQSGFPRPYEQFIALDDYAPIDPSNVPDASIDLVTCFVGLHHIPEEKITSFLVSIQRVLRAGGSFVLMEHDADSPDMRRFVDVVHTVFNAATGVKQIEEEREIRNFHSLEYWSKRVEQSGLRRDAQKPIVRVGDSTRNSLVRFTKPVCTVKEISAALEKAPGYRRNLLQTYLTAPEWYNVRVTQAYAKFITHTPFFRFSFFRAVKEFWRIFAHSWNAARKHCGFWEVALSEYTLMNLFIGITMTLEFCAKGLMSIPVNLMYGGDREETETLHLLIDSRGRDLKEVDDRIKVQENFGAGLQHITIPRYYPCTEIIRKFAREGVMCLNIAGQKLIQIDVTAPISRLNLADRVEGCKKLYAIPSPESPNQCITTFEAEVEKLHTSLPQFERQGWALDLVHDY